MTAASSRSASILLRCLVAAILALSLALTATATADSKGNQAEAINEKDGSSIFDLAFEVRRVSSGVVDQTNSAVAYSSCESCQAVAIAFQIVLVSGSPDTVAPTNLAVAINEECTTCQTIALAYQFVFGTGQPLEFSKEGRERLREIRKGLKALGEEGLTPDEIRTGAQQLADEVKLLLSTGLVPRKPDDDLEDDDGAPGEEDDDGLEEEDDLDEASPSPGDESVAPDDEAQPEPEVEPEPVQPEPLEPAPTEPAPEDDPAAPVAP